MSQEAARAFVLKLGRGLHSYGYPAHRLEDAVVLVSRRLGLEAHFFSMPTALFASFEEEGGQRTFQIRVEPGEQNLGKLTRLDAVATAVAVGGLTPEDGARRVDEIVAAPPPYGPVLSTLCFALVSSAAARFFGGGLREILVSAAIGLAIGLLAVVSPRLPGAGRIFEPLAAALAAFLATLAAHALGPVSVYVATVSGLIVLVPGFPLTVALTELATRNLVSGTTRLMGALGTFLTIGFGVALGTTLAERLAGPPPAQAPSALPEWTLFAALGVAPLGLTVLLKAEIRDAAWIVASGAIGFFGARAGANFLGPELGAFFGALAVGVFGNVYARITRRPAAVTVVPGLLLLVPGSVGFQSFSLLLENQTTLGIETAFRMTLVAISLATGLLFANVVAPPRRLSDGGA